MYITRCLLIFFLCSLGVGWAQEKRQYTISGYLSDAQNGEKLISAKVYEQHSQRGVLTNAYGFYSLSLPAGPVVLTAGESGYEARTVEFELMRDTIIHFALKVYQLEEVSISADEVKRIEEETDMSAVVIPIRQIKSLPALLGEVDVIKAVQLLPGVQSGSEGSTGLYVRGGGPDQNLILLDDVPLYYVSHLGGLFSVFNADALSYVKLIKGGFPARYGGRLSSVLDIRMKEGNMKRFEAEGSIGLLASKLSIQGPIIKDKTSFIVSGRRTYLDLLTRPISRSASDGEVSFGYYFYDLNAKINHIFSDKDRLYLSTYLGDDDIGFRIKDDYGSPGSPDYYESRIKSKTQWGNKLGALRWNHIWNPSLFSNLTATYTDYRFGVKNDVFDAWNDNGEDVRDEFFLGYRSGIRDVGARLDFDWYPHASHRIGFGVATTRHQFTPGLIGFKYSENGNTDVDTTFGDDAILSLETSAYVEDKLKIGQRLSANLGVHAVWYREKEKDFYSLQPRLSARYQLMDHLSIKASYVEMTQYIHLLTNSSVGLPIDLWVPATDLVPPQTSQQAAVGIASSLWDEKFELSLEGYYKKMHGLIAYKEGVNFFLGGFTGQDWQRQLETDGEGEAYGLEFLLQKKKGKTTGWLGYTLSWNNRQFSELNAGIAYPYKYDRRHDVSLVVSHKLSDRVSISGTWVYGTGNAFSLASGGYALTVPVYGLQGSSPSGWRQHRGGFDYGGISLYENGKNGFRMEDYHRLDLGISFTKEKSWGERSWNISIYNAYNRRNPFTYYLGKDYDTTNPDDLGKTVLKRVSIFPIIPSVSYSFKFK